MKRLLAFTIIYYVYFMVIMYLHMSIKVLRDVQTLSVSSLYRLGHWSKNLGSLGSKLRLC